MIHTCCFVPLSLFVRHWSCCLALLRIYHHRRRRLHSSLLSITLLIALSLTELLVYPSSTTSTDLIDGRACVNDPISFER